MPSVTLWFTFFSQARRPPIRFAPGSASRSGAGCSSSTASMPARCTAPSRCAHHRRRVPARALAVPRPVRRAVPHQAAGPLRRHRAVQPAVRRGHRRDRAAAVRFRGDGGGLFSGRHVPPGARRTGRAARGAVAADIVLWLDKAPSAEIDMTLLGWVTAALVLFHRALERDSRGSRRLVFSWVRSCASRAARSRSGPRPRSSTSRRFPLLAWRRQLRLLFGWRHLLAVGLAAAVCAAVGRRRDAGSGVGNARRDGPQGSRVPLPAEPQAKGYPWAEVVTYPLLVWAAHLPLSLFALRTLRPSFFRQWDDRGRLLLQLLHCWTWPNLLFWALVPNHNVRYALPLSPGADGARRHGAVVFGAEARVIFFSPPLGGGVGGGSCQEPPLREGGRKK